MSTLDKVAGKTAINYSTVSGHKEAALDPATILTFVELISNVIGMLKACKANPTSAASTARSPGLFQRLRLRSLVRGSMSGQDFANHGEQIISALYKTGKDITVAELTDLLK